MINRELTLVSVSSFTDDADEYGQRRYTTNETRNVEMVIKPYSNQLVDNPKFNDIELIALTKDRTIDDSHQIHYQDKNYDVIYVIPSFRENQLFLRECK